MARTKKTKPPVEPQNFFHCVPCDCDLEPVEVAPHLLAVHQVAEPKGQRRMVMQLDAADSYSSTHEWTVGGVKLMQYTRNPRKGADKRYWGE